MIVKFKRGFGSDNGTDAKHFVVTTCAGRRQCCLTYFESLGCAFIKQILNRSLVSLVFSLAPSHSKPSMYKFLYNLAGACGAGIAAELGKMGNNYRCLCVRHPLAHNSPLPPGDTYCARRGVRRHFVRECGAAFPTTKVIRFTVLFTGEKTNTRTRLYKTIASNVFKGFFTPRNSSGTENNKYDACYSQGGYAYLHELQRVRRDKTMGKVHLKKKIP